jgi:hypothetical protein
VYPKQVEGKLIRHPGGYAEFLTGASLSQIIFSVIMNWTTIYITGKLDFQEEVRRKLEHSRLNLMPGYIDNSTTRVMHDLYWLDEKTDVRALKEAVGSKTIWKYRLRFYTTLETFLQAQDAERNSSDLTKEDFDMIASMREVA